ncbi:MAG TPA: hypothetical protein VHK68_07790 [Gemmatimonadales bacterium]|jgi:hypothetical protein|nr:hypothetical protein [Gemmatimonadales bacterium]
MIVINSESVTDIETCQEVVQFTNEPDSSEGVTGSGTSLIVHHGLHTVRINFPPGFSGLGKIGWLEQDGKTPGFRPPQVLSELSGETWIELGLDNQLSNGTETVFFSMFTDLPELPTVVSDPPPSLMFQSS